MIQSIDQYINDREEIDVNKMQDGLLFRENIL